MAGGRKDAGGEQDNENNCKNSRENKRRPIALLEDAAEDDAKLTVVTEIRSSRVRKKKAGRRMEVVSEKGAAPRHAPS